MKTPNLFRLPKAAQTYIHDLEVGVAERDAEIVALKQHVEQIEEQHRLALAQQYAPKSEKGGDKPLHRLGEEISEQLHMEVKITVRQHARFKYPCWHCEKHDVKTPVTLAPMPARLASTLTARRCIAWKMCSAVRGCRSVAARWIIGPAELNYTRLYDALKSVLLSQLQIHGDETSLLVLKERHRKAQDGSYMWVCRSAADSEQPIVLFDYQTGRGADHPQVFLGNYAGAIMSDDGWPAWRTIKTAMQLGCMAHARRMFVDAAKGLKGKSNPRIERALEFFQALYKVETLAGQTRPEGQPLVEYRHQLKQQHSVPLLNTLKAWFDEMAPKVLPTSLLVEAIGYSRRQWPYLSRYVEDGSWPIDNNIIERDIRPLVTGRKSWLFSNTPSSTMDYSLMLACRASGVEPHAWRMHVLSELPQRPADADISDWLPSNYAQRQAAATNVS